MKSKMFLVLFAMFLLATPIFAQRLLLPAVVRSLSLQASQWHSLPAFALSVRAVPSVPPQKPSLAIPALETSFVATLILGLAFIESLALFTFVVIAAKF